MSVRPPIVLAEPQALGCVRSLDYFGRQSGHGFLLTFDEDGALVAAVGKEFLQERIAAEQRLQDQQSTITVLT